MPAKKAAPARASVQTRKSSVSKLVLSRNDVGASRPTARPVAGSRGLRSRLPHARALFLALMLVVAAGWASNSSLQNGSGPIVKPSPSIPTDSLADGDLFKSAVMIIWGTKDSDGSINWCFTGSGSQIVRTGLILTNSHIAADPLPEDDCDPKSTIWIGYQDDPKSDLYYWYPGETIALDARHDLGLVEVDFEGDPLAPGWPVLQIAELSDEPKLGAPIRVFGYPGIGGDSITFTSGYVAGWARDQGANEDAAVLKIDITIAGGSSGSAVLDTLGRVVGVVMMGGVSTDGSVAILDCRQLVDTNGDGKIDDDDSCQPLGGFLNGAVALGPLRAFLRAENVLP